MSSRRVRHGASCFVACILFRTPPRIHKHTHTHTYPVFTSTFITFFFLIISFSFIALSTTANAILADIYIYMCVGQDHWSFESCSILWTELWPGGCAIPVEALRLSYETAGRRSLVECCRVGCEQWREDGGDMIKTMLSHLCEHRFL